MIHGAAMTPPERRSPSRETLVEDIAAAIREELSGMAVPEPTHREHHDFIASWIEEKRRKAERAEKIKQHVGGWAIVSLISGIGTGAWHLAAYIREHLK